MGSSIVQDESALPALPPRPRDGHKGTFGRVLILGGSVGMTGAVALAGEAALRSGCGLAYAVVPASLASTVDARVRELVVRPANEQPLGHLGAATDAIVDLAEPCDAVCIGPGMGMADATRALVHDLLDKLDKPLLIDADGLNLLAERLDLIEARRSPTVLTPHPGEFRRLTGRDTPPGDREQRVAAASKLSRELGAIVLLKGRDTVITDGQRYAINPTGNSGMATAGSGDVLSGIITSLLGQGMDVYNAARLGAYLHGLAGDLTARELGEHSLIAGDLIRYLPQALRAQI